MEKIFEIAEAGNIEQLGKILASGIPFDSNVQEPGTGRTIGHVAYDNKNLQLYTWFKKNGGKTDIPRLGEDDQPGKTVDELLKADTEVQMWISDQNLAAADTDAEKVQTGLGLNEAPKPQRP